MKGPDFDYISKFVNQINTPVIASGGIGTLEDLKKLNYIMNLELGEELLVQKLTCKEQMYQL
jgi:phosphoribosylformimino-5-aminoimidazole carboxamide ribonucleotide (ProFAR) isomerase